MIEPARRRDRVFRSPWTVLVVALLTIGWSVTLPFLAEDCVKVELAWRRATDPNLGFAARFTEPWLSSGSFYRPMQAMGFAVDHLLWGVQPVGHHVTNLVLWLATLFVFRSLAFRLFANASAAAVATLFFAVSPTIADSVAWLDRDTLVSTLGTLATVRLVLCDRRRTLAYSAAAVTAAIAYCSKELAVIVVPVVVVLALATRDRGRDAFQRYLMAAVRTAPIWILAAVFVCVRAAVLGRWLGGYSGTMSPVEKLTHRLEQVAALLLPLPTRITGAWMAWIGPAIIAFLLVLGLRRCQPAARRWIWLAAGWILAVNLGHLPVVIARWHLEDARYLFPAVPPLCLLLAAAATGGHARLRHLLLGTYALVCVVGLVLAASDWRAAAEATHALRRQLTLALQTTAAPAVYVTGIPGMLRGAHFGIGADSMTRQPFVPNELAGRMRFFVDVASPHPGARRATAFLGLWRASLVPPSPDVDYLHWHRASNTLLPALREADEAEVRGRVDPAATASGRIAASVELAVHGSRLLVRAIGAPGSVYAVLLGTPRQPLVLGDLGVLRVHASALAGTGMLGPEGVAEIDVGIVNRTTVRAQVAMFGADGSSILSECAVLD